MGLCLCSLVIFLSPLPALARREIFRVIPLLWAANTPLKVAPFATPYKPF